MSSCRATNANAKELAAVVLDEAERNGITREELTLHILGGPFDERAQFWVVTRDWTPAEMRLAIDTVSDTSPLLHNLDAIALRRLNMRRVYLETDEEFRSRIMRQLYGSDS